MVANETLNNGNKHRVDDSTSSPSRAADLATNVEHRIQDRPLLAAALRAGWLAKALVYGAMAWIALLIGLGRPTSSDASYTGAIEELAVRPLSRLSLVVFAAGLLLYSAYRVVSVLLIDGHDLNDWAHRIGYSFSGATYLVVAWIAVEVAFSEADSESESLVESISRQLLAHRVGRILLGLGGLVAVGIASYFGVKGIKRRFLRHLDLDDAPRQSRYLVELTGAIGWFGRCIIVAIVGLFVTWAAIDADPVDARGLDRALQRLAGHDLGVIVVVCISALLFVYALFCVLSIPYRRLEVS